MKIVHGRVVWLTGASSGIGAAAAKRLSEAGYHVYGASRRRGQEVEHPQSGGFVRMLQMDVSSGDDVTRAAQHILQAEGSIDIVINCAGMGIAGAVEETSPEEAAQQFDTNVWGMLRVLRAALPSMRRKRSGLVLTVGSIAGMVPLPFQGIYSAGKFALEALTGALRHELRAFGVRACMLEPGDCRTGFTSARQSTKEALQGAYTGVYTHALAQMGKDEQGGMDPDVIARRILRIIRRKNPAWHNYCGVKYHFLMALVKFLPAAWMEKVVEMMYLPARAKAEL